MDAKIVAEANELIRYGLVPSLYGRHTEYHELASRYRTNHEFRQVADQAAIGLGLKIVEATDHGIYLSVHDPSSPFTPDVLSVSKSCTTVESRQLIGLCLLTIAAVAFERPSSLHSDSATFVSVNEVYEKLVSIAAELAENELDGGLSEGARIVLSRKTLNTYSKTEKPTKDTLHWHIIQSFEHLERQRMIKKENDREGGWYGTLPRYRALLANGGLSNIYKIVAQSLEKQRQRELSDAAAKEAI